MYKIAKNFRFNCVGDVVKKHESYLKEIAKREDAQAKALEQAAIRLKEKEAREKLKAEKKLAEKAQKELDKLGDNLSGAEIYFKYLSGTPLRTVAKDARMTYKLVCERYEKHRDDNNLGEVGKIQNINSAEALERVDYLHKELKMSVDEIARATGRKTKAIEGLLGIKRESWMEKVDKERLKYLFENTTMTLEDIGAELGPSRETVRCLAKELGYVRKTPMRMGRQLSEISKLALDERNEQLTRIDTESFKQFKADGWTNEQIAEKTGLSLFIIELKDRKIKEQEELIAKIIEMYTDGKCIGDIADLVNENNMVIKRYLENRGIKLREESDKGLKLNELDGKRECYSKLKQGYSLTSLARMFNTITVKVRMAAEQLYSITGAEKLDMDSIAI